MSLFGTQPKPNLFGSLNTGAAQPQQTQQSNLFGSLGSSQQQNQNQNQNQQGQGGGLFGSASTPTSGLFGASNNQQQQQQQQNNLFGASQQQPQQQQQGGGLFGSQQQPQQQNTLFGSQQQPQQSGLFGASAQPQQQSSLFGASAQPQSNSLFSGTLNNANQQGFGSTLQGSTQQQLNQSRPGMSSLFQPGASARPREKTIPEQMQTLLEKWSPESMNCSFEYYFYNRVQPEHVPYYGPQPGEDEKKWEEALAKKPAEGDIPALCRGFAALGNRLRIQVQSMTALQARLHEINNSLTAQLQEHDNRISIRIVDSRRRHVALSQRCLHLATKVQILRNRGYALDSAEEALKKKLADLEKSAFDPSLSGREEEIWARMVGVREQAQALQEQTKKMGLGVSQTEAIDETILSKTKLILQDYDSQITHLQKEIDSIRQDFEEWEGGNNGTK